MDRTNSTRRTILISFVLACVTFCAYLQLLQNDFIKFDDRQYVLDNFHVRTGLTWQNVLWSFETSYCSNWHPLTWISHMLDVQLFGLNPARHHFTSLLLHVANTLLLFVLLARMTGAVWRSAFVAAFFALHPLHVESVAWVAERKDVLSTFFMLLTIGAYVRYVEKGRGNANKPVPTLPAPQTETQIGIRAANSQVRIQVTEAISAPKTRKPVVWYVLALFLFALGLMSKPMLVTLPFVLLLMDCWPLSRFQFSSLNFQNLPFRRLVLEKAPFFALAAVSCVVTFLAQRAGHSVATTEMLPIGSRLENVFVSYILYLGKTLWPVDLAIFYPYQGIRGTAAQHLPAWQVFGALLLLLAISAASLASLKRRPWLAVGWLWYLGTLVPVIGFVQVGGQALADRYTYIPLIGIFLCLVWIAADLLVGKKGFALVGIGLLATVACFATTRKQVQYWRNNRTLFEHALNVTTRNSVAHYNLGVDFGEAGDFKLAAEHFRRALEIDPSFADAYYSLAYILTTQGKTEEAIEQYQAALRLKPWHAQAHLGVGAMLWTLGKRKEALEEYTEAVRLNPELVEAHYNLGVASASEEKFSDAEAHFAEAVRLKPDYLQALSGLAEILARNGKPDEAEKRIREILRLLPANTTARINLASLLKANGKREAALEEYSQILSLDPGSIVANYNSAVLLLEAGRAAEAASRFAAAAREKPDFREAFVGLGRARVMQGEFAQAQAQFREAARLSPTNIEARIDLGNALMLTGETNEAAAAFAGALRLDPGLARRMAQNGKALLEQEKLGPASASLSTALYLNPGDPEAHQDLGLTLARQGKLEEALLHFEAARRLRPDAQAYYNLALIRVMQGQPREAAANYEQAIKLKPGWAEALNDLAWLRATSHQSAVRDGAEAVRLAELACAASGGNQARYWGTLAAAWAEFGKFEQAATAAEKAIALATTAGQKELVEKNTQLLELYRSGKPYHESSNQ